MNSIISHLKLEKGSVLVFQSGDLDRDTVEAFREAIKAMDLDFKVPIIAMDESNTINVQTRDQVVAQLDQMVGEVK